jgi:hypothetical protein
MVLVKRPYYVTDGDITSPLLVVCGVACGGFTTRASVDVLLLV